MNFEALKKNFEELNEQMEAARKEMQAKSVGFVEAACKQFFDTCPEVESVFWTQYTPYFNDGDACEFGVHDKCYILVGDEDVDDYEGSIVYNENALKRAENNLEEAIKFTADPAAWRQKYCDDYKRKWGRPYGVGISHLRPYPHDPAAAQDEIDKIKQFFEKYSLETVNRIEENFKILSQALGMIDEDIMKAIYGDHVKVTISRTGTEIDEYDHD